MDIGKGRFDKIGGELFAQAGGVGPASAGQFFLSGRTSFLRGMLITALSLLDGPPIPFQVRGTGFLQGLTPTPGFGHPTRSAHLQHLDRPTRPAGGGRQGISVVGPHLLNTVELALFAGFMEGLGIEILPGRHSFLIRRYQAVQVLSVPAAHQQPPQRKRGNQGVFRENLRGKDRQRLPKGFDG
ncbi:MAG: hypothetical protein ACPL7G_11780, partial [Chloroflexia bacterium]